MRLSERLELAYNTFMKINIPHIAQLANLKINPEDEQKFETQLSAILDHVARLNEVDTTSVEETSQVTGLENISDEDIAVPSLSQSAAISEASSKHNGFFAVKGIFENE